MEHEPVRGDPLQRFYTMVEENGLEVLNSRIIVRNHRMGNKSRELNI